MSPEYGFSEDRQAAPAGRRRFSIQATNNTSLKDVAVGAL